MIADLIEWLERLAIKAFLWLLIGFVGPSDQQGDDL